MNVFIAPCGLSNSTYPVATALLAATLFVAGVVSLVRSRGTLITLLVPIALAMLASAIRRYPFHGRLLVYLVPPFVLLLGQGMAVLGQKCGRFVLVVLVLFLIGPPTLEALNTMDHARPRGFDSHGDPRNDLLDYFEKQEAMKQF